MLTYVLVRRRVPGRPALAACLCILLGSPLLVYTAHALFTAHASSFLGVAAFVYACDSLHCRWREGDPGRRGHWLLLGLSASLMVLVRYSNVVFLPIPLVLLGASLVARPGKSASPGRWARGVVLAAAGALPLAALQVTVWKLRYGTWYRYTYREYGFEWSDPHLVEYLFSHRHGVFFFAPVLLLAVAGLVMRSLAPRPRRDLLALAGLLSVAGLAYMNASWWCWWFGDAFGARSFVAATPLLAIGLAGLLASLAGRVRKAACVVAGVLVAWTCLLLVLQLTDRIADDGSTTFAEIMRSVF